MKKTLLILLLIPTIHSYGHETCVTQCADGYKLTEGEEGLYSLCDSSPDHDACRCILAQAFCNLNHRGLEPGTCPNNCNVASESIPEETFCAVVEYLREELSEDEWRQVADMLSEQGFYCGE